MRPTGFATNTRTWADQIRPSNVVRWVYGQAARSLIDERDIAAVAVRALTEEGHSGSRYVVSGPEALTQVEQVQAIGHALDRSLHWEEIPPDQLKEQLEGIPDSALDTWANFIQTPEIVTSTVHDVTGRPAHTFAEWAHAHAHEFDEDQSRLFDLERRTGVWNASATRVALDVGAKGFTQVGPDGIQAVGVWNSTLSSGDPEVAGALARVLRARFWLRTEIWVRPRTETAGDPEPAGSRRDALEVLGRSPLRRDWLSRESTSWGGRGQTGSGIDGRFVLARGGGGPAMGPARQPEPAR